MWIWDTLDIGPTDDITVIRKAYAAQLKLHHPEDDPEGYQRLREAYDMALKLAKRQRAAEDRGAEQPRAVPVVDPLGGDSAGPAKPAAPFGGSFDEPSGRQTSEPINRQESDPLAPLEESFGESFDGSSAGASCDPEAVPERDAGPGRNQEEQDAYVRQEHAADPLDLFMENAEKLYDHFAARISPERWMELLQEDVVWDLRLQPMLVRRLLIFFDRHYYLPASVWELLTRAFQWIDVSPPDLHLRYPNVFNYAYDKTYSAAWMNYETLLGAGAIDYEAYLRHREAAWLALRDNDLPAMKFELDQAALMYDGDPDLMYLQTAYCWRNADYNGALACSERFDALLPERYDHWEALLLASAVLEKKRRIAAAAMMRGRANAINPRGSEARMAWQKPARKPSAMRVKYWTSLRRTTLGLQWVVSLIILLVFVLNAISSISSNIGGGHSIRADQPVSIWQIPDVRDVPMGSKKVSLELTDLYFTGIQEMVTSSGGEERRQYIVYEDPDSLTDRPNSFNASGYIFIGFSKGITYYVSVNYDMAAAIMKLHRATIEGYVYFLFPEGLKAEVANQGYGRRPAINTKSFRYLLAN